MKTKYIQLFTNSTHGELRLFVHQCYDKEGVHLRGDNGVSGATYKMNLSTISQKPREIAMPAILENETGPDYLARVIKDNILANAHISKVVISRPDNHDLAVKDLAESASEKLIASGYASLKPKKDTTTISGSHANRIRATLHPGGFSLN